MGIFDFLKTSSGPDYEILDIEFDGGNDLAEKRSFGSVVRSGSTYLFARLRVDVHRAVSFRWLVGVLAPGSRWLQGRSAPQGYLAELEWTLPQTGRMTVYSPGLAGDIKYNISGQWHYFIYDEDGNILISKAFYVKSAEDEWREHAYMSISGIEFSDAADGKWVSPFDAHFTSELGFLRSRIDYASRGLWDGERRVTLDIEIRKPNGSTNGFKQEVTVKSGGGVIEIRGFGTKSATYYTPGEYEYGIFFEGLRLYSARLTIAKSPKDSGYIHIDRFGVCYEDTDRSVADMDDYREVRADRIGEDFLRVIIDCRLDWSFIYSGSKECPKMYLKIIRPDGELFRTEGCRLRDYSDEFFCTGADVIDFKFRSTRGGRFVTGEYRMSLWTKIYTGEMICLGVCRFRVV